MKLKLTQGRYSLLDRCDAHLKNWKWFAAKKGHSFYAVRNCRFSPGRGNQRQIGLHHCIVGNPLNNLVVDHINGNGLDNRRANLRIVSIRENNTNTYFHRKGKLPGATLDKRDNRWRAYIKFHGKAVALGYHDTEFEAHQAYLNKLKELEEG